MNEQTARQAERNRSVWLHIAVLVLVYGTSGGIALGLASLAVSAIRGCI